MKAIAFFAIASLFVAVASGLPYDRPIPTAASAIAFKRKFTASYNFTGGVAAASTTTNSTGVVRNLPTPRQVSNVIFQQIPKLNPHYKNELVPAFGKFLANDISRFALDPSATGSIPVPTNDPFFTTTTIPYIPFKVVAGSGTNSSNPPRFLNLATPALDLDSIYGWNSSVSDDAMPGTSSAAMRTFVNGKLRTDLYVDANTNITKLQNQKWLGFGNLANNMVPGASIFALLFVLEHNRLCDAFMFDNPNWTDEQLYTEARRMTIAYYQKVVVKEWMPATFAKTLPTYTGYVNTSVSNIDLAVTGAALRFGHMEFSDSIRRMDASGNELDEGPVQMADALWNPDQAHNSTAMPSSLIFGMVRARKRNAQAAPCKYARALNTYHSAAPASILVTDLIAIDIQRGRELGLTGTYNSYRVAGGAARATSFNSITTNTQLRTALASIYPTIDDVDLYVGLIVEATVSSSSVGATLRWLLPSEIQSLRDSDKYWFENKDYFTDDEITQILNTNLRQILMRNFPNMEGLPAEVFYNAQRQDGADGLSSLEGMPISPDYPFRKKLSSTVMLSWNILEATSAISFELRAVADGWVGIGFNPLPSTMKGADLIFCSVSATGVVTILDEYSPEAGVMRLDTLLGGQDDLYDKSGGVENGVTVLRWKRAWRTSDANDAQFEAGVPVQVIYAYHPTIKDLIFHGPTRAPRVPIDFFYKYSLKKDAAFISKLLSALGAILIALGLGAAAFFVVNRGTTVVRAATMSFCLITCLGVFVGGGAVIATGMERTKAMCVAQMWLVGLAFDLVYGSIVIKTLRIYVIFVLGGQKLKRVNLPNSQLFSFLGMFVGADAILLLIWSIVDAPSPTMYVLSSTDLEGLNYCKSRSDGWVWAFLALKLFVLVAGAFFAIRIRKVDANFNESSSLGTSSYISLVMLLLGTLLSFLLRTTVTTGSIVQGLSLFFALSFTLGSLVIPKVLLVMAGASDEVEALPGAAVAARARVAAKSVMSPVHKYHHDGAGGGVGSSHDKSGNHSSQADSSAKLPGMVSSHPDEALSPSSQPSKPPAARQPRSSPLQQPHTPTGSQQRGGGGGAATRVQALETETTNTNATDTAATPVTVTTTVTVNTATTATA